MQTFLSFVWTLGMILCEVCGWLLRSRWFSRCFLNITLVRKLPDPQNKGLFLQAILLARVSLKNFGSNLKMKASLTQVLGSAITELSRSRPLKETLKTYFCIQFQVECRVSIYKVIIVIFSLSTYNCQNQERMSQNANAEDENFYPLHFYFARNIFML